MYSKDTGKDQMLMTMERALTSGQKAGFFFLCPLYTSDAADD